MQAMHLRSQSSISVFLWASENKAAKLLLLAAAALELKDFHCSSNRTRARPAQIPLAHRKALRLPIRRFLAGAGLSIPVPCKGRV